MKTTIFLFHPDYKDSRVNKALASGAKNAGITVRNLYDLYPDGEINVNKEQAVLESTDRIVLQFPMYWYSSPSLLKEWEDKVFEHGWAYGSTGDKLHGKELILAVSPGAPTSAYHHDGKNYTVTELLRPFQATSSMIGTKYLKPFITVGATSISDADLANQVTNYVKYLEEENIPELGTYEEE